MTEITTKEVLRVKKEENVESYLKRVFPLEKGEIRIKISSVGINRYRINIWGERKREESLSAFKDYEITRSYYVIVKRLYQRKRVAI